MFVPVFIIFLFEIILILVLILTLKYKTLGKKLVVEAQYLEEQYKSVIDSANDRIIVIDHESIIKSWNKGAECIFQFQQGKILDKDLLMIIPEEYRELHMKGVQRYLSTQNPKILLIRLSVLFLCTSVIHSIIGLRTSDYPCTFLF